MHNQDIWNRVQAASFLTTDEKRAAVGYPPLPPEAAPAPAAKSSRTKNRKDDDGGDDSILDAFTDGDGGLNDDYDDSDTGTFDDSAGGASGDYTDDEDDEDENADTEPSTLTYPDGTPVIDPNTNQPYPNPPGMDVANNVASAAAIANDPDATPLDVPIYMVSQFRQGGDEDYQRPDGYAAALLAHDFNKDYTNGISR